MKYVALITGRVVEVSTLIYLSEIKGFEDRAFNPEHVEHYLTIIWNNGQSENLYYRSIDDCEEDYWTLRKAMLNENNEVIYG